MRNTRSISVLLMGVLLSVVLASCGTSHGSTAASTGGGTGTMQSSGSVVSAAQLKARLLTVGDLGNGWSLLPESGDDSGTAVACLNAVTAHHGEEAAHAEGDFSHGGAGSTEVDEYLAGFANVAQAIEEFGEVKESFDSCGSFSTTYSDGSLSGQLTPIAFAAVGADEQQAYRLTAIVDGAKISAVLILARKATINLAINYTDPSAPVEPGAVETIAKRASAKL